MKVGPFQFRDVHKDDKDADPFEIVGQMFRQLRDIVDQINKAPFVSDNVLRRTISIPTQAAADERPILIVPEEMTQLKIDSLNFTLNANLAAGTAFTVKRYTAGTSFGIASYDTTVNGATTAYGRKAMTLAGDEKIVLAALDVLSLLVTGNVPTAGILTLNLREVYP